jgi:hypothetical protein
MKEAGHVVGRMQVMQEDLWQQKETMDFCFSQTHMKESTGDSKSNVPWDLFIYSMCSNT